MARYPKCERRRAAMREQYLTGQYTIYDIAEMFGVTHTFVSRVLNDCDEDERARIKAVVRRHQTQNLVPFHGKAAT